jgi:zinc-ribbon domain
MDTNLKMLIGIIIGNLLLFILPTIIGDTLGIGSAFAIILTSIYIGYAVGGNYRNGAFNGAILGIILAIIYYIEYYYFNGTFIDFSAMVFALTLLFIAITFGIFGAVGGLIGIFIKGRRTSTGNTDGSMGYLVCDDCGGYYELKEGESIDDFEGCSCGGKFKYVASIDELKLVNQESLGDRSICPNCGSENLKNVKFCGSCGNSLNNISKKSKSNPNISDKPNKYRNKRTYGIIGIGIVIIAFLILFLPNNISANHYDNGYIAFNYPSTWNNITVNKTATKEIFNSSHYGGEIANYSGGNDVNGFYNIQIGVIPLTDHKLIRNNLTAHPTYGKFSEVDTNILGSSLNNYTSLSGEQPKVYKKNEFTYYELGNTTHEYFPEYNTIPNGAVYTTFIDKNGYLPYFFYIGCELKQSSNNKTSTEGYNIYKQIVDSFSID